MAIAAIAVDMAHNNRVMEMRFLRIASTRKQQIFTVEIVIIYSYLINLTISR